MQLLPALRQACARPADHKKPSLLVPSLPDCGDRPASASTGTSSRRKRRNFLSTSERRIEILLLNLRRSAPVCPQYYGTCPTCSAWCSGSLTGLTCGCRDCFIVFLAGTSCAGRHRSCQACQQARHAGSTNADTRDGPGSSATASSQTPRAAHPDGPRETPPHTLR
ncbi:mucin TcMUCII [Trypanosoma cruzi]|nr:mucin TcMUCII [Trypanosoma cruzi]